MNISDNEIYENRKKCIEFLKQPGLKKTKDRLEDSKSGGRCCLGHMCVAMDIKSRIDDNRIFYGNKDSESDEVAPQELMTMLGLYYSDGGSYTQHYLGCNKNIKSLTMLNDETSLTPQEIGEYLESVIMGGENTPWKSIEL